MATVDECVRMAEEAGRGNAHVAAIMHYRNAAEAASYGQNAASVLLAAVQYAQRLKKPMDRTAVAAWAAESLGRVGPGHGLEEAIGGKIVKLQATGDAKNAASS